VLRDKNTDQDDLCDDERLYYLTDANMNVTCLTDTGGYAVERYVYDPYGKVTILNGANGVDKDGAVTEWAEDGDQTASDVDNAILYCGYRFDNETSLERGRRTTQARPWRCHFGSPGPKDAWSRADGKGGNTPVDASSHRHA
jgi:hypothetical protein